MFLPVVYHPKTNKLSSWISNRHRKKNKSEEFLFCEGEFKKSNLSFACCSLVMPWQSNHFKIVVSNITPQIYTLTFYLPFTFMEVVWICQFMLQTFSFHFEAFSHDVLQSAELKECGFVLGNLDRTGSFCQWRDRNKSFADVVALSVIPSAWTPQFSPKVWGL